MKWETDVTNNNQEVLTMKYKLKPIQPMPNVLAMTKLLGKPRRMRDSDKDGVIDMLDCEPYNPKKQGILHDVGKWAARKVGVRKAERWIGEKGKEADEIKKVRSAERRKQRIETATYREKIAGERRRKYIKAGGFFGTLTMPKGLPTIARPRPVVKRRKKKKKGKRKTTRTPRAPTQPAYGFDLSKLPRLKF